MVKLTMCFFFMIIAVGFSLAVYGGIEAYTRSDRLDIVASQKAKITNLELKIRELRRINSLIPILEQLLIPRQIAELEAEAELIRQKRHKSYERYEQPLITEKERS